MKTIFRSWRHLAIRGAAFLFAYPLSPYGALADWEWRGRGAKLSGSVSYGSPSKLHDSAFPSDSVMASSLSTLADRLTKRLEQPLPGHEAHLTMAPQYPARRADLSVNDRDCREAGVLVLLLPHDDDPAVVLTIRREHLPDHAGQISFPGGQRENNESLPETALREAEEEIDLLPASVQVLGRLTPLYIPPSNFCVHPFVGSIDAVPDLRPTDAEVEQVLQVPLAHLLNPATRQTELRQLDGSDVEVPYYNVAGHTVWGATAMMLAEFLAVAHDVVELDE